MILVYTHSKILVIQAIWLVHYVGLWRYIHRLAKSLSWTGCFAKFQSKNFFLKYKNIPEFMILKVRKDFMVFKQRDTWTPARS